jgi:hypothetical protein
LAFGCQSTPVAYTPTDDELPSTEQAKATITRALETRELDAYPLTRVEVTDERFRADHSRRRQMQNEIVPVMQSVYYEELTDVTITPHRSGVYLVHFKVNGRVPPYLRGVHFDRREGAEAFVAVLFAMKREAGDDPAA